MKLKSKADIERIARAIEKDAGHSLDSIRDALADVRDGNFTDAASKEQLVVRAARTKTGYSQSSFAEIISTPLRTLQEWEQGRSTPPGVAVKLCELILENPSILKSAS